MRIVELVNRKGAAVVTASADESVARLVALLAEHGIGAVVVMAGESVVGIVSERDIARRLHDIGATLLERRIGDIMTADPVSCAPDADVDTIAALMTERRIRHVPVIADGVLVGLVSIGDVVKSRIDDLEAVREQLVHYIAG